MGNRNHRNADEGWDRLGAMLERLDEQIRAANIRRGLPADYEEPIDEILAQAAVIRAENDLAEAQAILAATQRSVTAAVGDPHPIEAASFGWPVHGAKVACPECGARGFPGGRWTRAHAEHAEMPCGRVISTSGRSAHRSRCGTCSEVAGGTRAA